MTTNANTNTNIFGNEFVNKPSKRPIDSGMLRPWQRTINLTGNAMKLIDSSETLVWAGAWYQDPPGLMATMTSGFQGRR